MKPVELEKALEKCDRVHAWSRDETLRRWRWAIDSFIEGYIERDRQLEEMALFVKDAEEFLAEQAFREFLTRPQRQLTEAEQERRNEWLRQEAARAVQVETRRQRSRLREGHQTLTAIRKLLAHGARSYRGTAFELAKTSPTS